MASATGSLSASTAHKKNGVQSLAWQAKNNDALTISNLQISATDIYNYSANSAQFWIYSKAITNDTLVIKFFDNNNSLKREGRIVLNYSGWRDFHRSYRYDYNFGTEQSGFLLNRITITYRGYAGNANTNTVFLDEMTFANNASVRIPGPHNGDDYKHFRLTSNYTKAILAYQHQADIAPGMATAQEISAIQTLKNVYKRNAGSASAAQITEAKNYVKGLNIIANADGTLNGRGIYDIYELDTLLKIANYVAYLSRAYIKNNDTDALSKLNSFMPYLLEQGLAEGGRIVMPYNNYTASRNFPIGFLEALPLLNSQPVQDAVIKMLKWSHEFNTIYDASPTPGLELDYMYLKSNLLLELALLGSDNHVIARDLKSFSRYLKQYTYTSEGARDGLKIDGTGFHHQSAYINYQYSYTSWISRAHELKGTPFKISAQAYENMKSALKTLFLQTSKGVLIPHSASGRAPFTAAAPVNASTLEKFIEVGGDLLSQPFDADMAQFYNYVFQNTKYAVPAKSWNGYHQFNYAQTGVYRKDNWIAVAKGLTSKMFGAEIYTSDNRYGRYQGYGALEILYGGTLANSGYLANGNGWDWNMMPGTTTVLLPYESLKPNISGTASEYQQDDYAGALANDKYGIFGLNFVQNPGVKYTGQNLSFKQSVFTFDSLMLCLGSSISAQNPNHKVISTLFQNVKTSGADAIYVNQVSQSGDTHQQIDLANQSLTLLNTQGTGYYVPKGNKVLNVFRGNQTSPVESSNDTQNTTTAYASKAWIDHGTLTNNSNYQYVVVPATTANKLQAIAQQIDAGELFNIIKQTDSLHAVQSLEDSVYAFNAFYANPHINIGKVSAISSRALFFIKEAGGELEIKIASPDLNAVEDAVSEWKSAIKPITITLKGTWDVANNPDNAAINQINANTTITFNLKDGLAQQIKLSHNVLSIKDPDTIEEKKPDAEGFKLYPNPFQTELKLLSDKVLMEDIYVYDVNGRLVTSLNKYAIKAQQEHVFNLSALKAGTYFILINNTTQIIIKQ